MKNLCALIAQIAGKRRKEEKEAAGAADREKVELGRKHNEIEQAAVQLKEGVIHKLLE